MANNELSINDMLTTVEKMLKNTKNKMKNASDYETLNNTYQMGLGICSTAGNLKIIDKAKYDEFVNDLQSLLKDKIVFFYKIDLSIIDKLGLDCCVRLDNAEELKLLYTILKVTGKLQEKMDLSTMTNFPYAVDLSSDYASFIGTTNEFNAIDEVSKNKTILPFRAISKE